MSFVEGGLVWVVWPAGTVRPAPSAGGYDQEELRVEVEQIRLDFGGQQ